MPAANFVSSIRTVKSAVKSDDDAQAVPSMESNGPPIRPTDSLFSDRDFDYSKYLSSTDLPAAPGEFFDDLFHGKVTKNALERHLPGLIKIKKEEPDSNTTSRCSTPESLLPDHDFDNAGDFPTPQFQETRRGSDDNNTLMGQLQSIPHSNATSGDDSDGGEDRNLNTHRLKAALDQLEKKEAGGSHRNALKSPRSAGQRKPMNKGSEEYMVKRERNNVAVRKSRTKAKLKHIETQMRVGELTEENDQLRNRITALQKELDALKSFFALKPPPNGKAYFNSYPGDMFSATKLL